MLKISAIDVGSNAMRMVVGEIDESWRVNTIENIRLPVRLGEDVFSKGYLEDKTIQRTEEAFLHFKHVADRFDVHRMRAVATSAAREAANGDLLIDRVLRTSGTEIEIINGDEEARLIHSAVAHALDLQNKRTLLIDIGGGSVEVTISTGRNIISTDSYNLGTVRLLEKLNTKSNSKQTFGKLVREFAEAARYRIERDIGEEKIQICAGTGGNVEEIGRLRQKLFKGESDRFVTLEELERLIERLNKMSYDERMGKLKLRPDRADVILPASIVLHLIASEAGVKQIAIPNVGLKDGILLDITEELSKSLRSRRREQVWESALYMGRKYQFDEKHARLTAKLAARLFEQSKPLHNLDDGNLLLLEIGALLHDIGHFINSVEHDKHGYYLLSVNHLIGFTLREQNIVANLVRYHRKPSLSNDGANIKSLPQRDRLILIKLCALLQLADSMDISHTGHVTDVTLLETKSGWRMKLLGKSDLMLENWAFSKRKSLFREVFGVNLEMN
ncbi:MAG: Ppx/GppA family phosphatase [Anaerolineae bacterium]|nr:Ppx/GppA family phosphatase [Anaerolineae bacterium]